MVLKQLILTLILRVDEVANLNKLLKMFVGVINFHEKLDTTFRFEDLGAE